MSAWGHPFGAKAAKIKIFGGLPGLPANRGVGKQKPGPVHSELTPTTCSIP